MDKRLKKLDKEELLHLIDLGLTDIDKFIDVRHEQKRMKGKSDSGIEPCWDCRMIAIKLGIE